MQEFNTFLTLPPKPKLPFLGSLSLAHLNPIPKRFRPSKSGLLPTPGRARSNSTQQKRERQQRRRRRLRPARLSLHPPRSNDITALQTSLNPWDSVRALQRRRWSLFDLQYLVCLGFLVFAFSIAPSAPLPKTAAALGMLLLFAVPLTRQFFLPGLPIWTYLIYFFTSRFIPVEYRPHIWVRVLPALENVLYGANLSDILSAHTHPVLDMLAWFPYGLGHFGAPAVCALFLFLFAAPGTTPVFARCFGYLSMLGVTMALVFPCTPPWYEKAHGLEPARYGMEGSPAGLARIDQLLGVDMYTTSFTTAPLPFGAFPSLHAADATIEALFMSYCFPRLRALFILYVGWIWWATMYLNHHYAVDLVGGSSIAAVVFFVARQNFLPRRRPGKTTRWQYEYVEVGEKDKTLDEEMGYQKDEYGLDLLRRSGRTGDSDEWTTGSSSSFYSTGSSSSRSEASLSPTTPTDEFHHAVVGVPVDHVAGAAEPLARESEMVDVVIR